MTKANKNLDFEVNLIPFISLLSVCICFLLLTAVWLLIGAMNVKQAVGGQPASETEKKPTVWVAMNAQGDVTLDVRDSRSIGRLAKVSIAAADGKPNLAELAKMIQNMKQLEPALNTALIQPQAASVYEDIIDLMDQFKKSGVIDLGVSPL